MADDPVPTAGDDEERVAADKAHLEDLGHQIDDAKATHEATKASWQSGLIPQVEGDTGEGNADDLQT